MRVSLAGWASRGLRCPDISIDLMGKDGVPAKVALIQMPNGTGKTTTLSLLRAALTGRAMQWSPDDIRELRRPGADNDTGEFQVTLQMDGKPLTFELSLDFEAGTAAYRTTLPSSGGVIRRWDPPASMLKFLTPEFLDLFIFDGEFADELLKPAGDRADEAIGALCQLNLLGDIDNTVEGQWKQATSQGGPKSAAALEKLNGEIAELVTRQTKLQQGRENALRMQAAGVLRAEQLQKKITDKVGSVETTKAQHGEAQQALQNANVAVDGASKTVMSLMRMPLALHPRFVDQLVSLRDNLETMRLPETSTAQFFRDLVEEPECICGRVMTDVAIAEINKRAKGILDYEEAGTINALKSDITLFTAPTSDPSRHEQLQTALVALTKAKRQQRDARQTLDILTRKLIDAGDAELEGWKKELDALNIELEQYRVALIDFDAPSEEDNGSPIMSLKLVAKKIDDARARVADLSKTVELKKKTDTVRNILAQAEDLARATLRADLLHDTNERLGVVLANDPLRVAKIDRRLHLANQRDASAGQKLSIGYTFLMSALSRGNNEFPLVVDSPAGSIDEGVRRNIGRLIPALTSQFVGFTINTERPGFVPALEQASNDMLFLTLFRRTPGTKRLEQQLPAAGVTQTDTATLVKDRDYFMRFDMTDEETL